MANLQPPIQENAYTSYFLNLAAGYWWEYTDQATGQIVKLECVPLASDPHKFQLKSDHEGIPPEMVIEVREVPGNGPSNQECIWHSATMAGHTLTWQGGLHFPIGWNVGRTVEATSVNDLPGHAKATLNKKEDFKPPSGSIFTPGGFQPGQIDIVITVKVDIYTVFNGTSLKFVGGLGLFSANFTTNPGSSHALILKRWSGRP